MPFSPKPFSYHLFLCADQSKPKCCQFEVGLESWKYLKQRIIELELSEVVNRTKANCLRVCADGPVMVVYPDGTWYHSCTPEVIERVLQEHVLGGKVVSEYVIAENNLRHPVSSPN